MGMTAAAERITLSKVNEAAARLHCRLVVDALGPAYKISLEWMAAPDNPDSPELVGFSDGFSQPTGVVHLESIQVRRFTGYYALSRSTRKRYASLMQAENGLGLLLSVAVACWIRERCPFRCSRAQLLAIRDEPRQHATLVRYYRRLGFRPVREVRNGPLKDAFDLITWGGEGTLMELTVDDFLAKWGPAVSQMGQHKHAEATS
mmetsp:Transcript_18272/g.45790  ORF Transcript_18272/g.45790 Transcript_18272/m.45790 type:complete len:204 (+) Transcript_18272:3-614(+)